MKMLIGGQKVDSSNNAVIKVLNPTTHEVIDTVPTASKQDCEQAIVNSLEGFKEWAATPMWKRIDILAKCVEAIKNSTSELSDMLVRELGVPSCQAPGEIAVGLARGVAALEGARYINGDCVVPGNHFTTENDLILTTREPLGSILGIIPFNFPIGTFCTKVFPALAMGNSVVAKLPSDDPLGILRVAEIMLECGVPGNVLQCLTGRGSVVGEYLIKDSRFAAVSMTGSTSAGAIIAAEAGRNILPCRLELGGNDALIILPDADLSYAVPEAVRNRNNRSGQICHSSKRFLVHNSLKKAFLEGLTAELSKMPVGDPADPKTIFGPLVSEKAAAEVERQIQHTVEQGGRIIFGGKRFNKTFVEPTVMDCPKSVDAAHDMEIFGPAWTVVGYDTIDEAIEIANDSMFGLSSGVIGRNAADMLKVAKAMKAGTCVINGGGSFAAPYSPFGGYKMSGIGRQSSMENLKDYSQLKTICFRRLY